MAYSITDFEDDIFGFFEPLLSPPKLNPARELWWADENQAQDKMPYATLKVLANPENGRPYSSYKNQDSPDLDLDESVERSTEVQLSINLIGGKAISDMGDLLSRLQSQSSLENLLSLNIGYLRNSGLRDLSVSQGGKREQRAQADVFFHISLSINDVVGTIQKIEANLQARDIEDNVKVETTIKVE
jgi:hypothetical protein